MCARDFFRRVPVIFALSVSLVGMKYTHAQLWNPQGDCRFRRPLPSPLSSSSLSLGNCVGGGGGGAWVFPPPRRVEDITELRTFPFSFDDIFLWTVDDEDKEEDEDEPENEEEEEADVVMVGRPWIPRAPLPPPLSLFSLLSHTFSCFMKSRRMIVLLQY